MSNTVAPTAPSPDTSALGGLPRAGQALLPGLLAWERLSAGHRIDTWLCWSSERWCPVVVKLAATAPDAADVDVTPELRDEASNLELVGHPGFPRLWHAGWSAATPHLVLEYVEGPNAATLHAEQALTWPDVVLLGTQLAGSLRYLHRRGLVHLDVKPANVAVREGRAVLLDLGSLTPVGRAYPRGDAPCTPGYAAPEVVDLRPVTPAADVHGLGAALVELCEGLGAPPGVGALLRRMTDRDPSRRPATTEVLVSLAEALPAGSPAAWPVWASPRPS